MWAVSKDRMGQMRQPPAKQHAGAGGNALDEPLNAWQHLESDDSGMSQRFGPNDALYPHMDAVLWPQPQAAC